MTMVSGIYPASSSGNHLAFAEASYAGIIPPMAIRDRIEQRMKALGLNPNSTAIRAGLPRDAVRDIVSGKSKHPRADTIAALSRALECDPAYLLEIDEKPTRAPPGAGQLLPIRYEVAAGSWLAVDELQDQPFGMAEAARIRPYEDYPQWLERIRGDSINRLIPDGALAHVVDAIAIDYRPRQDDLVVVARFRAQGAFVERTVKQIEMTPAGIELWPRSFNPRWSEALRYGDGLEDDDDASVVIVGLVIRAYMPFRGMD